MANLPDNHEDEQAYCTEFDFYNSWRDQVSPEDEVGLRLHSLSSDAAALIGADGFVSKGIQILLAALVSAIRGCPGCKRMLGEEHTGSCPTGGRYVLSIDLDSRNETPDEPLERPF
jgi:hypothetical protein